MWGFAKRFANANEMQRFLVQKTVYFYITHWISVLWGVCPTCTKNAFSAPVLPVSSPKTPFRTPFCPFSALIRKIGFSHFSGIFTPKSPLFWLQLRNFPHFAHHFDARQNAKQMQMIRRKNRRKTSGKSVKIFTNPTSYRGIRKCPKTLPREEKSTASWGKNPNYAT